MPWNIQAFARFKPAFVGPCGRAALMELTWVTIAASLAMGLAAAFLFVFAVKQDWFRDLEDTKYQVFWSDQTPLKPQGTRPVGSNKAAREAADDSQSEKK